MVLIMNKLEGRKRKAYGQLTYYAYRALKTTGEERREYQKNIGISLCVLDGTGLLDDGDFLLLQDMRYSDLEHCFRYVNNKAGNWYEI